MSRKFLLALLLGISAANVARAQCLIPQDQLIVSVAPDAIPAITAPNVVSAEEAEAFLLPRDRVLGVVIEGEARAYPLAVLRWHEIVNDVLGGVPVAVNYCPLTGSGMVYDPVVNGSVLDFGVSGFLFDNNNVMFDRATNSLWVQMRVQSVCGELAGTELGLFPVVQTSWPAWKALHPDTTVVSFDTGFDRNYRSNPYFQYGQLHNREIWFPQSFLDERRPLKELVLGITHEGVARAYPYTAMGRRAVNDVVNGKAVLVVFDEARRLARPFDRRLTDPADVGAEPMTLTFDVVESDAFPFVLTDRETGSTWDLSGRATDGALAGARLTPIATYSAYWFAWSAFHRGTEIYVPESDPIFD